MKDSNSSEDFINSLKKAYKYNDESFVDDCPMQSVAIAFATRELDAGEQEKFRGHLHTCRSCLDLVFDIQAAEAESKASTGQPFRVLPALSHALGSAADASRTHSNAGEWRQWFARFFTAMASPKFVSSAAVACLAFIVIHFAFQDPEVGRQLNKILTQPATPGAVAPPATVPVSSPATPGSRFRNP